MQYTIYPCMWLALLLWFNNSCCMTWAGHSVLLNMILDYFGISWSLVYWLVPALHVYMYIRSRHHFLCMFSDSDLSIYMYLLDFGFLVLWSLLYYTCSYPSFPLVFYSTCLLLLSYYTMCSLAQYHLLYIYLLLYACAHDTIFNACLWFRFIDTRVLIYARHLAFASPHVGEFWLP